MTLATLETEVIAVPELASRREHSFWSLPNHTIASRHHLIHSDDFPPSTDIPTD